MGSVRTILIALSAVVITAGVLCIQRLRTDEVSSGGVQYRDATIESIDAKNITFTYQGKQFTRPNDASARVKMEDFDDLNDAEEHLANKEYQEARASYKDAADHAKTDLQRQIVKFRAALRCTRPRRPTPNPPMIPRIAASARTPAG